MQRGDLVLADDVVRRRDDGVGVYSFRVVAEAAEGGDLDDAASPPGSGTGGPRVGCLDTARAPQAAPGRYPPITIERYCVFCRIIAGQAPADIIYDSEDVMVFRNVLNWVPVMLLAVPKQHMTQRELWESDSLAEVGRVASEIGREHCPNGYRLASNLGWEAKQSQEHAHIHILGGTFLGDYVNPGGWW